MARNEPPGAAASPTRLGRREFVAGASAAGWAGFTRRYLRRSLEVFLYWMPVWVPLILLAQLGARGLRPARLEDQRLRQQEERLQERLDGDRQQAESLRRQRAALEDDIYLERLRRRRAAEKQVEIEARGLAPRQPEGDGE